MRSFLAAALCCCALIAFSSCSKKSSSSIVGKWREQGGKAVVEFRKDGSLINDEGGRSQTGKYKFVDDSHMKLEMTIPAGETNMTISLDCTVTMHGGEMDIAMTMGGQAHSTHFIRAK